MKRRKELQDERPSEFAPPSSYRSEPVRSGAQDEPPPAQSAGDPRSEPDTAVAVANSDTTSQPPPVPPPPPPPQQMMFYPPAFLPYPSYPAYPPTVIPPPPPPFGYNPITQQTYEPPKQ